MGTIWHEQHQDWRDRRRLGGKALRHAWSGYLGRLPWQLSGTLTFDPKRVFPVDRELASREAFWWVGLVGHLCRRPVIWAYAVERGRSGLWHLHVLLGNAGRPNRRTLEGVWRARNGHAAIKRVCDVPGIALYTTKSAAESEIVVSDTVTLPMFKTVVADIMVPMLREGE